MSNSLIARVRARCRLGSEAGFTLVEVMVAAGILLTALVAMAYTMTVALSYTGFSRQRQGATGLANPTLDHVRALDLTSHSYRVTVEVSWAHPQVKGVSSKVTTQSVFFSSSGCLSSGTHPFAAPCQPFFYATADTQPGLIQVSGSIGTTPLDPGGT